MAKRFTDSEAREIMLAAGFKPLAPYEKSSTPWKSSCIKCEREVSPSLNNVKSKGVTCQYCAGNAVHIDDVKKIIDTAKLKPLEDFPGSKNPWKCQCLVCGQIVSPTFSALKQGGGCKFCARKKVGLAIKTDEAEAIQIMESAGLKPLEPFKDSQTPWKCKCMKCEREVTPRLSMVKSRNSGCAFCAGRRVDGVEAEKIFRENGLLPLIPYPGNKTPWPSIHEKCGKEVSPTYQAVSNKGQGPCKFCAGVAVDPKDAVALFLSKDLKPLEPYSGDNKKPWRSIHISCGNEVSPNFNIIQQGESMGCHFCSDQFVDPDEAFRFFQDNNLQPLVPYPGTAKPWKSIHTVCGNVISPRWGHIRAGRVGCIYCAKMVPITQEFAFKFFSSKGLLPQEPFPGPLKPWKSIHTECGKAVSPQWNSVQQGGSGCKYCAGNFVDAKDAEELFKSLGATPLVPYPGGDKPWKSKHITCGREIYPRYSGVKAGQGVCRHCSGHYVDPIDAKAFFISRGLTPLVEYPGASTGWKSIHNVCGREVSPYYGYVKSGGIGCNYCAGLLPISPEAVKKLFISRGFKPLENFVNTRTPIRAIHKVCGKEVKPSYGSVRNGGGCKYCSVGGINLSKPGFLYLMTNQELGAHKIGIGGFDTTRNRIEQHKKYGWVLYKSINFETAESAYEVEQRVLSWIRLELALAQYLVLEQMPQGGHTETIDASEIDLTTIWAKVQEMSRVKA